MSTSPEVMSSSPTIIRRSVDFPHPDGPTRIMNSPSAMSRLTSLTALNPSPYSLTTFLMVISATRCSFGSALDRTGGEAGDDTALEQQHDDDDRNRDDDRRRHDRSDGRLELGCAREE